MLLQFKTLIKAQKNPQSVPHTLEGMVINKKTGKLEECSSQPTLPFPNALSIKRITIILILVMLIAFL